MTWLFFALLAPACWAITNLIDKDLVDRRLRDPFALTAITGLFAVIPAVAIAASGRFGFPDSLTICVALATGLVSGLAYLPYYFALKDEPPENAILVWNVIPAFVAVGAWLFLGESLSWPQYGGIALLVISSLLAEYAPDGRRSKGWHRAARMMIISSLLITAQMIGTKFVFDRVPYDAGFFWISIGSFGLSVALLFRTKTRIILQSTIRNIGLDARMVGNELLDVGATAAKAYAISIGPVSLVQAAEGVQPLFVMLLAATLFRRKQKRTRAELLRVAAATGLAIVGLWVM